MKYSPVLSALFCAFVLAGCATATELGAFDLQSQQTGAVDSNGFPIVVGPQYERDVPLKQSIERAALESELEAIAEGRRDAGVNVDRRRSEILQQRLQTLARTHGQNARDEIAAACSADDNGVVTCNVE